MFQWVPGHLDVAEKYKKWKHLFDNASLDNVDRRGNILADECADFGARAHGMDPYDLALATDRANFSDIHVSHLVASWANWLDRTKGKAEDPIYRIAVDQLNKTASTSLDHHDGLEQHPLAQEDVEEEEQDPFGLGLMDLDGQPPQQEPQPSAATTWTQTVADLCPDSKCTVDESVNKLS